MAADETHLLTCLLSTCARWPPGADSPLHKTAALHQFAQFQVAASCISLTSKDTFQQLCSSGTNGVEPLQAKRWQGFAIRQNGSPLTGLQAHQTEYSIVRSREFRCVKAFVALPFTIHTCYLLLPLILPGGRVPSSYEACPLTYAGSIVHHRQPVESPASL